MGMYDIVEVEIPLPDDWIPDSELQTKDFDSVMNTLCITKEGRLVSKNNSLFYKSTKDEWQDMEFHGWFSFYGIERRHKDYKYSCGGKYYNEKDEVIGEMVVHEYKVKFTDGLLAEIIVDKMPNKKVSG
jgi:hypothetical protein